MTFLHSGYNSNINLSAKDMLEISQEISRNFTPCFSSRMPELVEKIRLSPRELLDIGNEIGRDFAPKVSPNTSELTLLPVDPGHLYAYWHVAENREKAEPDNKGDDQLTLRIYAQPEEETETAATETATWFDVAIDSTNTQQQISLPSIVDETAYSAEIGKYYEDDGFVAFAHSNIIHASHGQAAWHHQHPTFTNSLGKNASGQGISKPA